MAKKKQDTEQSSVIIQQPALEQAVALPGNTNFITMAIEKGASIETIERLVALYENERKERARNAFHEALSAFQAEVPPIKRNRKGYDNNYSYAELDQIVASIQAPMRAHGFSRAYKFRDVKKDGIDDKIALMVDAVRKFDIEKKKLSALENIIRDILSEKDIEVTCIITHRDGHSEETTMVGPEDYSGFKNSIQSRGSSTTYLERYTLIGALGLVTVDTDNDGGKPKNQGNEQRQQKPNGKGKDTPPPPTEPQFVDAKKLESIKKRMLEDPNLTLETIEKHFKLTDTDRNELLGKPTPDEKLFKTLFREVMAGKKALDDLEKRYTFSEDQRSSLRIATEHAEKVKA